MIIDRIKQIIDNEKISVSSFEKKIGTSEGVIRRAIKNNTDIQSKWLTAVSDNYPEINNKWLLTGKGSMFKKEESDLIEVKKADELGGHKTIPLVSVEAIGGFGSSDFSIGERDVKDLYVVPKFKDRMIDFMIEVYGDSMYPKFKSGDIVACRKIGNSNFIQWNNVHIIATKEQGILIKRLNKSKNENTILAVSENKDYEPFEIPKNEVTGIALVVGVIRLE